MTIQRRIENGILRVTVSGMWTRDKASALQREVASNGVESLRGILLDARRATLNASTMDVFQIVTAHAALFPSELKTAAILSPQTAALPDARFADNLAHNRGIALRVFTDMQEAATWLDGESGAKRRRSGM